jgi:tryptophan synthase alpha subunit
MAARAADAEMMGVLLDALPETERTDLINAADKSGITPVFLAFQRYVHMA